MTRHLMPDLSNDWRSHLASTLSSASGGLDISITLSPPCEVKVKNSTSSLTSIFLAILCKARSILVLLAIGSAERVLALLMSSTERPAVPN